MEALQRQRGGEPIVQCGVKVLALLFGYGYQTWIVPGKGRQFLLRGLRGQGVFVDPESRVVMVHTAAGDVADPGMGERLALWFGAVKMLAK